MARVIVGREYIEYGSLLNYSYTVDGVKIQHQAALRRAIQDKQEIRRRMIYSGNGLVEQYNHDKKIFEPVEV